MDEKSQNDQPDTHEDQAGADQASEDQNDPLVAETHEEERPGGATAEGGLLGWVRGRGRWIAVGALAVLLTTGIGAGGYAIAAAGDSDGRGQVSDGGGRDGRGDRDRGNDGVADGDRGPAEQELTGADLTAVTAAVEADYPGSIIVEAETDSDGVFEAHIVTSDGDEVTVELDENHEITGTETDQ